MAYRVTNLAYTRRDPNKRGHLDPFIRKGRVMIGKRRMKDGRSIVISDEIYNTFARVITRYVECGAIKICKIGVSQEPLYAPSPTPPTPPEPPVEEKSGGSVEIDIIGETTEKETVVIQLKEEVPVEAAVVAEPAVEEVVHVAPVKEPAPEKTSNKKPRRKRKGND